MMTRLRRSFSLDFVNDDSATLFLHQDNHEGEGNSGSGRGGSNGSTSSGHGGSSSHHNSQHSSSHHHHIPSSMSGWHDSPDIDDALAADFDGSLSGLGMDVNASPYNMSDALLALPSLKNEGFSSSHRIHRSLTGGGGLDSTSPHLHHSLTSSHHHNHHHHHNSHHSHHSPNHTSGHEPHAAHSSPSSSSSNNTILSITTTTGQGNNSEDNRPVVIVHGKKNRLAFGHDEEGSGISGGTKRVCISSDRESAGGTSSSANHTTESGSSSHHHPRYSNSSTYHSPHTTSSHHHHHNSNWGSASIRESEGRESNDDECDPHGIQHSSSCSQNSLKQCTGAKHSNSAPDLRTSDGHLNTHHDNDSNDHSSSPSPTHHNNSVLTQILNSNHSNNSSHGASSSSYSHLNQHNNHDHHNHHDPTTSSPEDSVQISRPWLPSGPMFQYELAAATSMATKIHEETMTYLNQGQSYEIKLKKGDGLRGMRGKQLKSIIRVGFYERRLQFMEKELLSQWKEQRHSDRILEVDIPLSYGISDVTHDPLAINKCSFTWDPSKDTGVFVKVNCISTEFTPKKHGGEKGVPFRVIIETHSYVSPSCKPSIDTVLHAASSQVKVFKPKGADRKHKTDREKMMKRRHSEQEKFRQQSDRTYFTEFSLDSLYWTPQVNNPDVTPTSSLSTDLKDLEKELPLDYTKQPDGDPVKSSINLNQQQLHQRSPPLSPSCLSTSSSSFHASHHNHYASGQLTPTTSLSSCFLSNLLSPEASPLETVNWLQLNRFEKYLKAFNNFSGSDILRLNREDLIEICGLTDGIRLYNSLHSRGIRPRLTLYASTSTDEDFSAIYLDNLTVNELKGKLLSLITPQSLSVFTSSSSSISHQQQQQSTGNSSSSPSSGCSSASGSSSSTASCNSSRQTLTTSSLVTINRVCFVGPTGIRVLVSDEVVQNLIGESMFLVDFEKDSAGSSPSGSTGIIAFKATLRNFKP